MSMSSEHQPATVRRGINFHQQGDFRLGAMFLSHGSLRPKCDMSSVSASDPLQTLLFAQINELECEAPIVPGGSR